MKKPNELYQLAVRNLGSGKFKVVKAKKLTKLNQFKQTWKRVCARTVARQINNKLITR